MKYCYIVSAFVIIVLTISVVGGKHKGRRSKDHSRHKHMRLLTQAKHFRRPKNHGILTYSDHRHQRGKLISDTLSQFSFSIGLVRDEPSHAYESHWFLLISCKRKIRKFGLRSYQRDEHKNRYHRILCNWEIPQRTQADLTKELRTPCFNWKINRIMPWLT